MHRSNADWKELYLLGKGRLMNMPLELSKQCAIYFIDT
jgi:hypothetical protein